MFQRMGALDPVTAVTPHPAVLEAFGAADASVRPLGHGLINQTFLVERAMWAPFVLQRLHPIFPGVVNEDIDALTAHLARKGLVTPRLIRTTEGALWVESGDAAWRALTYVPGVSRDRLGSPDEAREAGALLARFHQAVVDFNHDFRNRRPGVHDTVRHFETLRNALVAHRAHPRSAAIRPVAERILELADALPALPPSQLRVVHGDPKINNIIFSEDGSRALCLIDLDTLGRLALPLELGDAFRSWCNPAGEDYAHAWFSLELFQAAVGGYAAVTGHFLHAAERDAMVLGIETIYLELAARFCADALNESYFGWDPARFASRSEHNQIRAESQLHALQSLRDVRADAEAIVARAFV